MNKIKFISILLEKEPKKELGASLPDIYTHFVRN